MIRPNLRRGVAYANYDSQVLWTPPYAPGSTSESPNMVDVGAASTPSPWLTFGQPGNVVEFTDTTTVAPANVPNPEDVPMYVKAHGGIAAAGEWQLWVTATGTTNPYGQRAGFTDTQGGARFGYLPTRRAVPDRDAAPKHRPGVQPEASGHGRGRPDVRPRPRRPARGRRPGVPVPGCRRGPVNRPLEGP